MADAGHPDRTVTPPRLILSNGAVESLKWLALILMTGDHVNKYLFAETLPALTEFGRLALPIFAVVLAYNLARPGQFERGTFQHTIKRLTIFALLAQIPFIALGPPYAGTWPLNILFTLLTMTSVIYWIERGNLVLATLIFLIGGSSVEFWWPALILGIGTWSYCKHPSWISAALALTGCASLVLVNGNFYGLAALPVIFAAARLDIRLPRLKWAFYIYYPLHLAVLFVLRQAL